MTLERVRQRISGYVYGNILVLAAIAIVTGDAINSGEGTIVVALTTLTTFFAHVIAQAVGQQLGREPGTRALHAQQELRDAWPILASGVVPATIFLIAEFGFLPSELAQLTAALWVIARLALIGFLLERLSGRRASWRTLSGGLILALLSAVVVVLKVMFAH